MSEEYKRSCSDELAWKEVDQLHEATLQISKQCFEYKKLCVGFVGAACALLVKFTDNNLDFSLFVVGVLISVGFWIADANAYYFQRKVRGIMDQRMNRLAQNNKLQEERKITDAAWKGSFFNSSMSLYYVMISLSLLGGISFFFEWIQ